jgi:hypothetical protein
MDRPAPVTEKGGTGLAFGAAAATFRGHPGEKVARRADGAIAWRIKGWDETWFPGKRWQCLAFCEIAWHDLCVTTLPGNASGASPAPVLHAPGVLSASSKFHQLMPPRTAAADSRNTGAN